MSNFLLIHGGSHGAWCWEKLIRELHYKGHKAFALDLPGHGLDTTCRNAVNRDAYIAAVTGYIDKLQLVELTLVGHSLAGIILPDLASQRFAQIKNIIFLAALVLKKGEIALDLIPSERRINYIEMAQKSSDNTFTVAKEVARKRFFNDLSDEEADFYYSKLTPQPLDPYLDNATIDPYFKGQKIRYFICKDDMALPKNVCASCAEKLSIIPELINTGHDPMLSAPKLLADLLVSE